MLRPPEYYAIFMQYTDTAILAIEKGAPSIAKALLELAQLEAQDAYIKECKATGTWYGKLKARIAKR